MKCIHCNLEFDKNGIHVCLAQLADKQAQKAIRTTPRIPAADGKSASFWIGRTPRYNRTQPEYSFLAREPRIALSANDWVGYYWHGGGELCATLSKNQFEVLTNGLTLEPGEIAEVTLHINKIKEAKLSTRAQRYKNPPKSKSLKGKMEKADNGIPMVTLINKNGEWTIGP